MNVAHAPIFDFLVHIMLVRRSKTLIFLYFQKLRYLTSAFDRPGFEALMEDVRAGKINCIVVKDLSRFGRNYLETGNYLERIFPYLGVRFVAVNDHFDTLTAERSNEGYIVPLKNIINAAYSKDISRKSSSALRVKQQNGEFIGSWAPYGYKKCEDDHHKLELDEEAAPIVRCIFQWRCTGMSYLRISRQLNQQGIPSPSKRRYLNGELKTERYANTEWQPPMVKKILRDETYLGHLVQGRRRTAFAEGKKEQRVPREEWIIVRNTHEALIDEETFRLVQQMDEQCHAAFQERKGKFDYLGSTPNIFRKLVFCADCKRAMIRFRDTNKGKKLSYTFKCSSHIADPTSSSHKYFHEEKLKAILWDAIQREIDLAENLEKVVKKYSNSEKSACREESIDREIAAAHQAQQRAAMLYDSLYQNYVDKLMTEQEYSDMKRKYRTDMEQAKARLARLEQQKQSKHRETVGNIWLMAYSKFRVETELTEEMTHALIERIEIGENGHVSVTLRYKDEYFALTELLKAEGQVDTV